MVVPLVSRGQISGIMTFLYTDESGRRYGRDDPAIAEEIALHAAQTFENARLMKNLKASESRFRIALAGARTVVYEQDTALRYVWY
jgi:GAF domain-containing protein